MYHTIHDFLFLVRFVGKDQINEYLENNCELSESEIIDQRNQLSDYLNNKIAEKVTIGKMLINVRT